MWIQISGGLAPVESCRAVYLFLGKIEKECKGKNIKLELMDYVEGEKKDTLKSAFLKLSGPNSVEYANGIEGTILWICKSPYRLNHKRKNWFIEVEIFNEEENIQFNKKDIKIETMRSSGNGGQKVNKVETGVRIIHIPSKIMVKAQEERSQHQNKKLAMARLMKALQEVNEDKDQKLDKNRWQKHQIIKRGDAVRTFKGNEFREVK